MPSPLETYRRFEQYLRNNVLATQQLLEAVKPTPSKRVVYASTSSVYGHAETLPTGEDALPRPYSPYGVTKHSFHHTGAYTIPNLRFDGYVVYTNRTPTTAMRGFGVTSVSFAVEIQMNRIAESLGIDPFELRLKNANRVGDLTANRVRLTDPSTVPVVLAAADRIGHELKAEFREMTNEPRSGELLPEHLLSSVGGGG